MHYIERYWSRILDFFGKRETDGFVMTWRFLRNVICKGITLFILFNLAIVSIKPTDVLARFTLYNWILPGRLRLPFGEKPQKSYNLSLYNFDAMFASHVISARFQNGKNFRIVIIGDSSVWGTLLRPEETLAGILINSNLICDEKPVVVYNLGYPTLSLIKDLMLLDQVTKYKPDLIFWLVTLESFPKQKQLDSPIVVNNPERIGHLINQYHLRLDESLISPESWMDRTIIGQRRPLSDWFRLQLYGFLWAATGIDQEYPDIFTPAERDLENDSKFLIFSPPLLDENWLAWDVMRAGLRIAINNHIPILIINEPILISKGENSSIRYNFYYPRWAYNQYREMMAKYSVDEGWNYIDLWDIVPETEFTNSAIHLSSIGEGILAEVILSRLNQFKDIECVR